MKWMDELRLGVIGAGNMAAAILNGAIKNSVFPAARIMVSDRDEGKLDACRSLGCGVTTDNLTVLKYSDIMILAVKPQAMDGVLQELSGKTGEICVVSIAAGISKAYLENKLGTKRVIRVMPNTPLLIGMGASALTDGGDIPAPLYEKAASIFSAAGAVVQIEDEKMNEVIFLNGSSPAFFFRMAEAMSAAAVEMGIDREKAVFLAAKTMEGAANMLLRTGRTPAELTAQVTSPGGSTLAALTAFDEYRFEDMIRAAAERCSRRAYEIGR